ncbi:MAG: hypothetical protein V4673_09665 [Pseudomonadota bacterium]
MTLPMLPRPPFAQMVDARLKSAEFRGPLIEHPSTPAVLQLVGYPALPLTIAPGVLFKIAGGKGGTRPVLTPRQLQILPELLDEAAAIFRYKDGLRVLTKAMDAAKNPIFVCVRDNRIDGSRKVNMITTAFGKADATSWAASELDNLLYVGPKSNPQLPLPGLIYHQTGAPLVEGTGRILLCDSDLGKFKAEQRAKNFAGV